MAQVQGKDKTADALPVLAVAALGGGTATDPELRELLKQLIGDRVEERRKEAQKQERLARAAVDAVAEKERAEAARRSDCNHRKQNNKTRLAGQKVTGTGQIALTCLFCNSVFHLPPDKALGQVAPPTELIPPADDIGGL